MTKGVALNESSDRSAPKHRASNLAVDADRDLRLEALGAFGPSPRERGKSGIQRVRYRALWDHPRARGANGCL